MPPRIIILTALVIGLTLTPTLYTMHQASHPNTTFTITFEGDCTLVYQTEHCPFVCWNGAKEWQALCVIGAGDFPALDTDGVK